MAYIANAPPVPNFIDSAALYDWARLVRRWADDNNLESVGNVINTIYHTPKVAPSLKFSVANNGSTRVSVALWPVSSGTRIPLPFLVNVSWPLSVGTPEPEPIADNNQTRLLRNSANKGVFFNGCSRVDTLQSLCAYTVLLHSTSTNVITLSCDRNTTFWPLAQFMNGVRRPATAQYSW